MRPICGRCAFRQGRCYDISANGQPGTGKPHKTKSTRLSNLIMANSSTVIANSEKPLIIKKYPDRRLYNTATHTPMTLDDLAELVRQGRELAILEAKSRKDITRSV